MHPVLAEDTLVGEIAVGVDNPACQCNHYILSLLYSKTMFVCLFVCLLCVCVCLFVCSYIVSVSIIVLIIWCELARECAWIGWVLE